jgi:hypothetical protein
MILTKTSFSQNLPHQQVAGGKNFSPQATLQQQNPYQKQNSLNSQSFAAPSSNSHRNQIDSKENISMTGYPTQ